MKLHYIGYELETNILFGTDQRVQTYNSEGVVSRRTTDDEIYDELEISEAARELIYGKNLLRFLGIDR